MKTVSFIREKALGDCLLTTGIIKEYKRQNPNNRIIVATDYYELFARMDEVDVVIEEKHKAIANSNMFYDLDLCYERQPEKPVLQCYADYVFGKGNYKYEDIQPVFTSNDEDRHTLYGIMTSINFSLACKYVVMHMIGDNNPPKCLPLTTWREVIDKLLAKGFNIAIVGTDKDNGYVHAGRVFDFRGLTDTWQLRALIEEAQAFIGVDSGCAHIAQTTNTSASIIYTTADPANFLWREKGTRIVTSGLPCQFCIKKTPLPITSINCKQLECCKVITSNTILGY
jgi:ADP-heptose:LPS heptosyltransferase